MSAANPFQNDTAERVAGQVFDGSKSAINAAGNAVASATGRLNDGRQANGPNYRMIAPSQNAPQPATKPVYSGVGDYVQNSLVPYYSRAVESFRSAGEPYAKQVTGAIEAAFGNAGKSANNWAFGSQGGGSNSTASGDIYSSQNGAPRNTLVGENTAKVGFSPRAGAMYGIDRNDPNGTALAATVNTYNPLETNAYGRTASQEFALANQIRQQTIDAQPKGAGIVIPGSDPRTSAIESIKRAERYQTMAANERDPYLANKLLGQARDARSAAESYGGMDKTDLTANTSLTNNFVDAQANQPLMDAQTGYYNARAQGVGQPSPMKVSDFIDMKDAGMFQGMDENTVAIMLDNILKGSMPQNSINGMAEGGIVALADGGMVPTATGMLGNASPIQPQMAALQEYQQYATGARAMGLPAVPFNDFLGLREGASAHAGAAGSKSAVKMAEGGPVPAAGKMVIDTDPGATTDSIPAMIDGKQPAALDSGEFVFPKDVVLHFGTDKLNKMIEQARKPPDGAGQPSAVGAAAAQ